MKSVPLSSLRLWTEVPLIRSESEAGNSMARIGLNKRGCVRRPAAGAELILCAALKRSRSAVLLSARVLPKLVLSGRRFENFAGLDCLTSDGDAERQINPVVRPYNTL